MRKVIVMRKKYCLVFAMVCALLLCACSKSESVETADQWDCSVSWQDESGDGSYAITYSNERVISGTGVLTLQNQNDFDITVHLLANAQKEQTAQIVAGGVTVLKQIQPDTEYTVGCHADVPERTDIRLMIYDGERSDIYSR